MLIDRAEWGVFQMQFFAVQAERSTLPTSTNGRARS